LFVIGKQSFALKPGRRFAALDGSKIERRRPRYCGHPRPAAPSARCTGRALHWPSVRVAGASGFFSTGGEWQQAARAAFYAPFQASTGTAVRFASRDERDRLRSARVRPARRAPNAADATKFIAFALGAKQQAIFAEHIALGPANGDALAVAWTRWVAGCRWNGAAC
jgi:hypothetical protein